MEKVQICMHRRYRRLDADGEGYHDWRLIEETLEIPPENLALIVCDVWDRHWCRGAEERLSKLLPAIAAAVNGARDKGAKIIHAPSDTISFYSGSACQHVHS